jgi:membrane associated rhomboid family serine protease
LLLLLLFIVVVTPGMDWAETIGGFMGGLMGVALSSDKLNVSLSTLSNSDIG